MNFFPPRTLATPSVAGGEASARLAIAAWWMFLVGAASARINWVAMMVVDGILFPGRISNCYIGVEEL